MKSGEESLRGEKRALQADRRRLEAEAAKLTTRERALAVREAVVMETQQEQNALKDRVNELEAKLQVGACVWMHWLHAHSLSAYHGWLWGNGTRWDAVCVYVLVCERPCALCVFVCPRAPACGVVVPPGVVAAHRIRVSP
jgi:hypothetical protein